jgi:heat shock protein 4
MDTDPANKEEAPPKKTRKIKKQVRKGDLPIVSGTHSLDSTAKALYLEKESSMVSEDKLVADTEEKKNELETYIYDLRNKLDDQYADLASEEEKDKIREKLTATEVSTLTAQQSAPTTALTQETR